MNFCRLGNFTIFPLIITHFRNQGYYHTQLVRTVVSSWSLFLSSASDHPDHRGLITEGMLTICWFFETKIWFRNYIELKLTKFQTPANFPSCWISSSILQQCVERSAAESNSSAGKNIIILSLRSCELLPAAEGVQGGGRGRRWWISRRRP